MLLLNRTKWEEGLYGRKKAGWATLQTIVAQRRPKQLFHNFDGPHHTLKFFTETVKISQKPHHTSGAPYQDLETCTLQNPKKLNIEYSIILGLDVLYLLCFGNPDRSFSGVQRPISEGVLQNIQHGFPVT